MIEVVNTTIDMPSRKHPTTMKKRVRARINIWGDRFMSPIQRAKSLGIPAKPIATVKKADPSSKIAIMHDVRVAARAPSTKLAHVKVRDEYAINNESATPTAAASVGEASPK